MNDGGPAFPLVRKLTEMADVQRGMTLRDWFAGQAIASHVTTDATNKTIAAEAYGLADAMLAEREKTK